MLPTARTARIHHNRFAEEEAGTIGIPQAVVVAAAAAAADVGGKPHTVGFYM